MKGNFLKVLSSLGLNICFFQLFLILLGLSQSQWNVRNFFTFLKSKVPSTSYRCGRLDAEIPFCYPYLPCFACRVMLIFILCSMNQHSWIFFFFFCDDDTILSFSAMVLFFVCFFWDQNSEWYAYAYSDISFEILLIISGCWSLFGIWFYPPRVDFIISGTTSYRPTGQTYLFCFFLVYKTVPLLLPFFPHLFSQWQITACVNFDGYV